MRKNTKVALIITIIGIVLCAVVRFYMITVCTDMNTGFLYHDSNIVINIIFYVLYAAFVVGTVLAAVHTQKMFSNETGESENTNERAASDLEAASAMGAAPALEAAFALEAASALEENSAKKTIIIGFASLLLAICAFFDGITTQRLIIKSSFIIFADWAFALYIGILAFVTLYKKRFTPGLGFAYSFMGVFFLLRGIGDFMQRMVINAVPEYLIECMIEICGSIFFVMFAKFFSGNASKRTKSALFFWSSAAAILPLSSGAAVLGAKLFAPVEIRERITFSRLAAQSFYQNSRGINPYMMCFPSLVNIALGIFALIVIIVLVLPKGESLPFPNKQPSSDIQHSDV